jgi:hypothetical protein
MPEHHLFDRDDVFPSWFANAIQNVISGLKTDLRLDLNSATAVEVDPQEPAGLAAAIIQGRWRFNTAIETRSHPGGAAGTYDVWAVATDNVITNTPDPHTDETDYGFTLRITPTGVDPSGTGVEIFEKIGEVTWNGSAITALEQLPGRIYGAQIDESAFTVDTPIRRTRQADGSYLLDIADNTIPGAKLADLGVSTGKLANLAVTAAKLSTGAADSAQSKVSLQWMTSGLGELLFLDGSFDTVVSIPSVPAGIWLAIPRVLLSCSAVGAAPNPYGEAELAITTSGSHLGLGETTKPTWTEEMVNGLATGAGRDCHSQRGV